MKKIGVKYLTLFTASIILLTIILFMSLLYYKYIRVSWSISIYNGTTPFNIKNTRLFENPVIKKNDVPDSEFVADPFMVKENGTWFMFFEVLTKSTNQGDIGYATSVNGHTWVYQGIVIDEKFHISFPYLFKYNGTYYMIPESSDNSSIRLYVAKRFPEEWELKKILFDNVKYVDSSIVYKNGYWWLFTSNLSNDTLRLFYAADLLGGWTEHLKSPLIIGDKSVSRSGGRIIEFDGNLYRFAQDCTEVYGKGVRAYKIIKLDQLNYEEIPANDNEYIINSGKNYWNTNGMHTIDLHINTDNTWIACVDGKGYNNFYEIIVIKINGFKNRIYKYINYYNISLAGCLASSRFNGPILADIECI